MLLEIASLAETGKMPPAFDPHFFERSFMWLEACVEIKRTTVAALTLYLRAT
jgi:hypothetical protein